jgi:hypothetical protein
LLRRLPPDGAGNPDDGAGNPDDGAASAFFCPGPGCGFESAEPIIYNYNISKYNIFFIYYILISV